MHRHKRFRHGPPLFRPFRGGWIWLIILGIVFSGGGKDWWPIILIVIGLYFLFGSLFREERPPKHPAPPTPFDDAPPPARAEPAPPPEPIRRPDLLPATCPNCGGPVRSGEVKWTSDHSAACSYCGSNLETRKQ